MSHAKHTFLAALLLLFVAIIWWGSFPHEASRVFLNQRRAAQSISDVSLAQRNYVARHPDAGYACKLSDLGEQGLVDKVLASGTKSGYDFELRCLQQGSQKATSYTIIAEPNIQRTTGKYSLCADQSGETWYSENGAAADCLAMRRPIDQKYR